MDKNNKKQRFYSIMILPHDAHGKPLSLKLPASWVYSALGVLAFAFLLVCSSVIYTTFISRRLVNYSETISKSQQQQTLINNFSNKTSQVNKALDELAKEDADLRKLLGLKSRQDKVHLSGELVSPESKSDKISYDIEDLKTRLADRKKSFSELKSWISIVRSRMARTPSGWPLYGRIASGFGYRVSPWHGMHTGLDIDARYGSPVRVTAPGVVTYVGWMHGYGKLVEVSHGYGVKTLYAHNSAFAVSLGERVAKGQVVSYVGTTGWTTGPHVHYEVRRGNTPVNPVAYLSVNILSASRLWR
jgi:murein DD-endopeptidase MepM/ murein hydrolase activator NlpD